MVLICLINKTILKPLEIDFYFPEYGIGVEINDIASHNSTLEFRGVPPKTKEYHQTKILLAQSCNIHLIHLYEWEVTDEEYMIKFINYLKLLFNIDIKHIGARQCVIKEINDEVNFLNEYHLQSYTKSKIKLGLYYKDDLVLSADLSINNTYTVEGLLGNVVIEVKDKKVRVVKENSPKNICSKEGYISDSTKPLICLPNKVVIKIVQSSDMDGVVY